MTILYVGVQTGALDIYRGNPRLFQMTVVDQNSSNVTLDPAGTAKLVCTTSISPDADSVLHEFTDLTIVAPGTIKKEFSKADTKLLPLGSFFGVIRYTDSDDNEYEVAQIAITVFPTQMN